MGRTTGRQAQRPIQMKLPFPDWGRRKADNDDCPFSAPRAPDGVLDRVRGGRHQRPNVVSVGLTLADAIARDGGGYD